MAANGQLVFTDVDKVTFKGVGNTSNAVIDTTTGKIGVGVDSPDANLHVLGNCFVSTNLELGGTMTMGTVTVNARHELSAITATGNTTPHTVEFQNATTGLVTTGNVSVGKDLTVTGNVAVDTDTFFVDSVNDMVGIGTTTPGSALDVVGDAAISSNLVVANSGFSLDTNGTLKQVGDGNSKYIKLMKYFGDASNWKIATGSYTGASYQWVSIRANITRLDQDVEIIQFNYLGHNGTSRVRDPIIIGGGATSIQANEIKVYNKTSNSTYEIYLQIDSATSVEVEISHRASTIDDDYSTVVAGAIDETGLTKIYDSGTTTDLRLKGGSVGIGTTNPGQKLTINGATLSHSSPGGEHQGIRVTNENINYGSSAGIGMYVATAANAVPGASVAGTVMGDIDTYWANGTDAYMRFFVSPTDSTTPGDSKMVIKNDGSVGLGTTSPSNSLHIYKGGAEATSGLFIEKASGGAGTAAALLFGTNAVGENEGIAKGGIFFQRTATNGRGDFQFCLDNVDNATPIGLSNSKMTITSDGSVGIGVTSPDEKLHVNGIVKATNLDLDGTVIRSAANITLTTNTWAKIADFAGLVTGGYYLISIKWDSSSLVGGGTAIWYGGVTYSTYVIGSAVVYNATGDELINYNAHYHYRTISAFEFVQDSDASNGSYGQHSIYMKSPQSDVVANGVKVTAYRIG